VADGETFLGRLLGGNGGGGGGGLSKGGLITTRKRDLWVIEGRGMSGL